MLCGYYGRRRLYLGSGCKITLRSSLVSFFSSICPLSSVSFIASLCGTADRLFLPVGSASDGFIKPSSITAGLPAASTCTNSNPTSTCGAAPAALSLTICSQTEEQTIYFTTLAPGSVNGQNSRVPGRNLHSLLRGQADAGPRCSSYVQPNYEVWRGSATGKFAVLVRICSVTQSVQMEEGPLDSNGVPSRNASAEFVIIGKCRLAWGGRVSRPPG